MSNYYLKYVTIFVVCVLVGLGIVIQADISDGQMLYVSPKAISDYKTQIQSELATIENLEQVISEKKEMIGNYQSEIENNDRDVVSEKLIRELYDYKIMAGMNSVHGEGVSITIDDGTRPLYDGEDINNLLVHDADILMIINELKKCNAEAISVNGHRITPNTYISCSGYTVRMDGMVYARPFVIEAIGDSKRMLNQLLAPDGYGTSLKNWGVQFSIEMVPDLTIKAAEGEISFRCVKPVKDSEMLSEKKNTEIEGE